MIPRMIVGAAVVVALAILLIVLVVVGDEIMQGEAVMRGNEIDAGPGFPTPPVEVIPGTGAALGEIGQLARLAFPKSAHGVAKLVVPFRPSRWEMADLVAPGADIPRLGNKFDLAQGRVLPAGVEKTSALIEAVRLAGEYRGEVEAEPVHPHFLRPVA